MRGYGQTDAPPDIQDSIHNFSSLAMWLRWCMR